MEIYDKGKQRAWSSQGDYHLPDTQSLKVRFDRGLPGRSYSDDRTQAWKSVLGVLDEWFQD